MRLHIFWDQLSPEGLQLPVERLIAAVTGLHALVVENPVRIMGFVNARKQIDAQAQLDHLEPPTNTSTVCPIPSFLWSARISSTAAIVPFSALQGNPQGLQLSPRPGSANEYYGLDACDDDLIDRIVKEGAHEVGHLMGLVHCPDRECIMFCPDTLDELNGKKKSFCDACRKQIEQRLMPQIDQI